MRTPLLAVALVLATLTAGCAGIPCERGPPVTARGIGPGTPMEGGSGDHVLTVRVTDGPGGGPLPDAGVVLYWASDRPQDLDNVSRVEVGPDRVVVQPGSKAATPEPDTVLRLRTGPDGTATARLPTDRLVGLVAAKDGYTEEYVGHIATGSGAGADAFDLPLYRSRLELKLAGTWGPGGGSTGAFTGNNYLWQPESVPFAGEAAADAGYAARLVHLKAVLRWNNAPTAFGDLGLGLGARGEGQPRVFRDAGDNAAFTLQEEHLELKVDELHSYGLMGRNLALGPASDTGFVAPLGLDYEIVVTAEFDRRAADLEGCIYRGRASDVQGGLGASAPAGGILVVLAATLGTAAVVSRRR
jgi:hypothetical protein